MHESLARDVFVGSDEGEVGAIEVKIDDEHGARWVEAAGARVAERGAGKIDDAGEGEFELTRDAEEEADFFFLGGGIFEISAGNREDDFISGVVTGGVAVKILEEMKRELGKRSRLTGGAEGGGLLGQAGPEGVGDSAGMYEPQIFGRRTVSKFLAVEIRKPRPGEAGRLFGSGDEFYFLAVKGGGAKSGIAKFNS